MKERKSFDILDIEARTFDARERLEIADLFISNLDRLKEQADWLSADIERLIDRAETEAEIAGEDLLDCYREMMDEVFIRARKTSSSL